MKNLLKILSLTIFTILTSCYGRDDDSDKEFTGQPNIFTGRIYTEDNAGIANVEVTLTYSLDQIGANYQRIIAKSKSDINGNYRIEGFVKDNEFNSGIFTLTVDKNKIENTLSQVFYKPSELVNEAAPQINELIIGELNDRNQVINSDYKIPYKTTLQINLNDFNPTSANDRFGVGNKINYGFSSNFNKFLTKQTDNTGFGYAIGLKTTIVLPSAFGENNLRIFRFKNGVIDDTLETVNVENPNTNQPLNYNF